MSRRDDSFELAQREIERSWRDLVYHRHPVAHFSDQSWAPPADVMVSEDTARVILELAGVRRESVQVRLRGRSLEINGRRSPPQELEGARYLRAEIYFGDFRRVIDLPWEADDRAIEAIEGDGLLEIRVHAAEKAAIPLEGSAT